MDNNVKSTMVSEPDKAKIEELKITLKNLNEKKTNQKTKKVGKIYVIVSETKIYVGSTFQTLKQRMYQHSGAFARYKKKGNTGPYCSSFEVLKEGKFKMELIQNAYVTTINELRKVEATLVRLAFLMACKTCCNKRIDDRTPSEWRKHNKDKIAAADKRYQLKNKDRIKAYMKEYSKRRLDCECGSNITLSNRSHHVKSKKHIERMAKIVESKKV